MFGCEKVTMHEVISFWWKDTSLSHDNYTFIKGGSLLIPNTTIFCYFQSKYILDMTQQLDRMCEKGVNSNRSICSIVIITILVARVDIN